MRGSLVVINIVPYPKSFLQRRMLSSLNEDKRHILGLMVKDANLKHFNASRVTDKAQNYLLLMVVLKDLSDALKQWSSLPTWNPLAQTVIVFMEPMTSEDEKEREVKLVFEELLRHGIVYANAVYQMANDSYKLIAETWFPYHDDCCANSVDHVFKIHECTVPPLDESGIIGKETIIEFNQFRYEKLPISFHDCPLKVSAFIWEPFVVGNDSVDTGLEVLMLQAITSQKNFNLQFDVLNEELMSKKITADNQSGIYADLLQK